MKHGKPQRLKLPGSLLEVESRRLINPWHRVTKSPIARRPKMESIKKKIMIESKMEELLKMRSIKNLKNN